MSGPVPSMVDSFDLDNTEYDLRRLITSLGESLAVAVEELERRGMGKLLPDSSIAALLKLASKEGR